MKKKRSTHPCPQRTPTIKPGPGHRGPVGGAEIETPQERKKSGIQNNSKGSVPKVGIVLRNKDENYKESFQESQECMFQYVVENYKKGVYLVPLIRKLEDVDL